MSNDHEYDFDEYACAYPSYEGEEEYIRMQTEDPFDDYLDREAFPPVTPETYVTALDSVELAIEEKISWLFQDHPVDEFNNQGDVEYFIMVEQEQLERLVTMRRCLINITNYQE